MPTNNTHQAAAASQGGDFETTSVISKDTVPAFAGEGGRTILNLDPNINWRKQTMFFGEQLGLSRYDQIRYPVFEKLTKAQKANFWSEEDVNLTKDSIDYNERMFSNMRRIFDLNISYQTVMDSATSRGILEAFLPLVSLPEVEECLKTWSFFESIHNRAYQWIEQNLHLDPSVHFDTILRNPAIVERTKAITEHFDNFIWYTNRVKVFGYAPLGEVPTGTKLSLYEHKVLAYKAMVAIYALESMRFYVSFSCTFAMARQEYMVGNAKEMKLIARDEALHIGISMNILRIWPKEDPDFKAIAKDLRPWVHALFLECYEQEYEFSGIVFAEGPLLGLNQNTTGLYLQHRGNKYLKAIDHDQIFDNKVNPYGWMKEWITSDEEQIAPQETENIEYKVNALDTSVDDSKLEMDF
jgi:ribonucleoside-diphosphate reductase beta chain